jgi:Raf kinase inhibitor-like YbhB/YbcL family protein
MTLEIRSSAFGAGKPIPPRNTCDGEGLSPELRWSGAPAGTRSFALIVDDPDAPDPRAPIGTFVHWVLYDMPPETVGLAEGVAIADLPPGTRSGLNDGSRTEFVPPCPPIGRHRYFHKLYALDVRLGNLGEPTAADLMAALEPHVLESTRLIGTYER